MQISGKNQHSEPVSQVSEEEPRFGKLPRDPIRSTGIPADLWTPVVLITLTFVVWLALGLYVAFSADPVLGVFASIGQVVLGLIATSISVLTCFLLAALFGTSFGEFKAAVLKLAAATMFPLTVAMLLLPVSPIASCLAVFCLTLSLLKTFFGLDYLELFAFVLAQSLLAAVAAFLLGLI